MLTVDSVVRRGALTTPDDVALIDGETTWTWADFDDQVTRAASALRSLGIEPGDRVAAAALNSAAYFGLYYGAARLGAVLCPLNYLNAPPELAHVLGNFEPAVVLHDPDFTESVAAAVRASCPSAKTVALTGDGAEWSRLVDDADPHLPIDAVDPGSVHRVLYTSGTTGRQKGVAHTHTATCLDGAFAALGYRLTCNDRYLVHAPSFHGACWDHAKMFFFAGGSVVLLPRFEPAAALRALAGNRVTVLFGVPAVLKLLMAHPEWPDHDLGSIRLVYYGGALGSPAILHEFAAALGRDIDYMHVYGLSEGGPFVSLQTPERIFDKPSSIGWPLPGVEMAIADHETGAHLAWGETGEIVVRSPTNMAGYWNDADATAAALRDGWLHTGDVGRRDAEGDFYLVDRIKDMVRSGGENVYAREVEIAILEHSAVAEAAVIGVPDQRWDERVVAVVRCEPGEHVSEADLVDHCAALIARYKLPKQVVFVEDYPRTGIGKISKHQLKGALADAGLL